MAVEGVAATAADPAQISPAPYEAIKAHLWGILNAIVLKQSNGHAEGMNSKVQRIKQRAWGFHNKDRFCNAIHFYPGGLDLYPKGIEGQCCPLDS